MPPKKTKGGKGKREDEWNDEEAEKKVAKLTFKDEDEQVAFDESEEETPRAKNKKMDKSKKRMTMADILLQDESENDSEANQSEEEGEMREDVAREKLSASKKEKKERNKKMDKRKVKKEQDELDELVASLDKKEEKVGKKAMKNKGKQAAAAGDEEGKATGALVVAENDASAEPTPTENEDDQVQEKIVQPDQELTEEEKKKLEKKRKEKEKKKEKEREKKEKEKEKKTVKKTTHVGQIKEMQRINAATEAEEQRKIAEENARIEAFNKAKEEEERLRKVQKDAEKKRKQEKIEAEKRAGRYLTPAQRAKQQQMLSKLAAANIVVARDEHTTGDKPKKRIIYNSKKNKAVKDASPPVQTEKKEIESPVESEPATPSVEEQQTADGKDWDNEEPVADDWEMAHENVTPSGPTTAPAGDAVDEAKVEAIQNNNEMQPEFLSEESSSAQNQETRLRAPIICVLGHVDTGKTKMLDTIRRTNVQAGEAGGITQQIGATQVPGDAIKERCSMVRDFDPERMQIPGFLIIDTPGHESFSNLRNRGSSLCDYAILVVDIMHGLEPQTIESLKLLLKRGTPFVIALNKIDRLYGYESNPKKDVYAHLKTQPTNTTLEFIDRYNKIVAQFAEQGVNVVLSNKNQDEDEYVSMVPTSAMLGDGIGNIMAHIVQTTQRRFATKLTFREELDATVMEVKSIAGLGTTIDVILVNGTLNVGDNIVLTGADGAIVTQIRELLMPQPLKEMRVKNEYEHFRQIKGAQGVKILAKGLEKALAGLPMFVAHNEDEEIVLRAEAEAQLKRALVSIKKKPEGVYVQASTLGSLEALLEFLKAQKIPYSNVNIGPVHRNDVQKAAVMLERDPRFACILAFDVHVEKEAQKFADHEGVKIFQADIIYHLEDAFLKYREELRLKARAENEHRAIFPCKLRVLPQHIFNARNPIICGVAIEAGQLKKGTPICVPSKEGILLGAVSSIERNHEQVDLAKAGEEVCIKIENTTGEAPKLYGRHFTHEDALVSKITRDSIDACKAHFRSDLSAADWQLVVQLKPLLDIM